MFAKKSLHILKIILFVFGIGLLTSCNNKEIERLKNENERLRNQLIKENEQTNDDPPIGLISVKEAEEWEKAYVETVDDDIVENLDYQFNREFFIPLKRMKQYIDYFKKEAKNRENPYKGLGLRIYIGLRPPKKENDEDMEKKVETIFIAPTARNANGDSKAKSVDEENNIYDIMPMNLAGSGKPPKNYATH